jgi:hypothetical protein
MQRIGAVGDPGSHGDPQFEFSGNCEINVRAWYDVPLSTRAAVKFARVR